MPRLARQFVLKAAEPRPGTPLDRAVRGAIAARGRSLLRIYAHAIDDQRCGRRAVHKLRSGVRRLEATLAATEPSLNPDLLERVRKLTRRVRRRAGPVRDADVLGDLSEELLPASPERDAWLLSLKKQRRRASRRLKRLRESYPAERLWRRLRRLLADVRVPEGQRTWGDAWCEHAERLLKQVRRAAQADLSKDEALHALRIELKGLKYALENFRACVHGAEWKPIMDGVSGLVELFGRFNDASVLADSLSDEPAHLRHASAAALGHLRAEVLTKLRAGELDRTLKRLDAAAGYARAR
ncbi:MAG: CHAD domain-containing protein [Phycisphaerales bacterium]